MRPMMMTHSTAAPKLLNDLTYTGFYTKLIVWGSLGLNFEYDGGPIIEIGGPIFLYKLPEDRKNSLWSVFSLIEIKKNTKKNSADQTATCFPFWEIWLVNLKYTWSCCHCILSVYKSPLIWSLWYLWSIADLSLSKWKCYVIQRI